MSTTIHIPDTIEETQAALGGIGKLLTAKDWERAAMVYAWTYEPGPGRVRADGKNRISGLFTAVEFAELGVYGLTDAEAVYRHRRNWRDAIDRGWAASVAPGDSVELPSQEYPANSLEGSGRLLVKIGGSAPVEQKVEAVQEIMRRDPEVARRVENAFVQKAAQDPALHNRIDAAYEEFHPVPERKPQAPPLFAAMGFGAVVYEQVRDCAPRLREYVAALEQRANDPEMADVVQEEIDNLEKTKALIEQYEDALRRAVGIDYDATFARLVGGKG